MAFAIVYTHGAVRVWFVAAVSVGLLSGLVMTFPRRRAFLVPRELPPPPRTFVGRGEEIERLTTYLRSPLRTGARLAVVTGEAGIGKTALVLSVAHRLAKDFPDGQLYARLTPAGPGERRGDRSGQRERLAAVVAGLVNALKGPGDEAVPADPGQRIEQYPLLLDRYRSLVAGRRTLIVLDDVRHVEDVVELMPPGRGSATVVTMRETARADWPDDTCFLPLGPLSTGEGLALLRRTVDRRRIDDEEADARAIVEAAKRHPLALQVVAVSLASRSNTSLARTVDRIRRGRDKRDAGGATGREHPLDAIYPLLNEQERRAVMMLGFFDETELTPWRLAALLGDATEETAAGTIDRLVHTGLVERTREDVGGLPRLRVLDHVLEYAQRLVTPAERARLRTVLAAAERGRSRVEPRKVLSEQVYRPLHRGELRRALTGARRVLALAQDRGDNDLQGLAYAALAEVNAELGGVEEARDLAGVAMRLESRAARPRALRCIGKAQRRLRQLDQAAKALREALTAAQEIQDVSEQVRVLGELAIVQALGTDPASGHATVAKAVALTAAQPPGTASVGTLARLDWAEAAVLKGEAEQALAREDWPAAETALHRAVARLDKVLALAQETEQQSEHLLLLAWSGHMRAQVARLNHEYEDARGYARVALTRFKEMRHRYGVAQCRLVFGQAYLGEGRLREARQALEEALESFHNCGDRWADAEASRVLALVHARANNRSEAIQLLRAAEKVFGYLGDRRSWEAVRGELERLSPPQRLRLKLQTGLTADPAAAFTVAVGATGGRG